MKVAVRCDSPLLQRSLEIFLHDRLSSIRQCDVIIRDKPADDDPHPTLVIGTGEEADLVKPFSRSQLVMMIEKIGGTSEPLRMQRAVDAEIRTPDLSVLEEQITRLTQAYQEDIMKTIREFYAQ